MIDNSHPQPKKSKNTTDYFIGFGSWFKGKVNGNNSYQVKIYLHWKNCLIIIPEDL
jgi:hypothetical protein